ncbi:hypothetical protein SpCBS45565_g01044 [Spizellomyces sp. 'palustris']|nr:hypothetical protein SpCBS45565_g01044 [Spizellomyces sp. 'palustris']
MASVEGGGLSVGLELASVTDATVLGAVSTEAGYSFGVLQLLRPGVQEAILAGDQSVGQSFFPSDLQVTNATYAGFVLGGISPCDALDSGVENLQQKCEALVKRQVQWATHLGLSAVLFSYPTMGAGVNFARAVNHTLSMLSYTQAWVRICIEGEDGESWKKWNLLRTLCEHNTKLSVALELPAELPEESLLLQWLAEPVKAVILPTSAFISNNKGFPVLSKRHQSFVRKLMEQNVQFVISAESADEKIHPSGGLQAYQQYIHHLYRTRPEPDVVDKFASGYHDYLQQPLQPLMDNLESATYEVFEKDPIKYQEYERAIYRALLDRAPDGSDVVTVIMVVGAGRGPLVQRALQAAEASNRQVKVYAIEKNPNAVVTLRCRKESEWEDLVDVIHCDMRYWEAPEQADILVSELLGSFGDNELSPECLDGAQRFLKENGISIPSSYTAFVSPLSSTKLYHEVSSYGDNAHLETPYVVKFRAAHELAAPLPVWSFEHPHRGLKLEPGVSRLGVIAKDLKLILRAQETLILTNIITDTQSKDSKFHRMR